MVAEGADGEDFAVAVVEGDACFEGFGAGGGGEEGSPAGVGAGEGAGVVGEAVCGEGGVCEVAVEEEVFEFGAVAVFADGVGGVELRCEEGGGEGALPGAACAVGVAGLVVDGFEGVGGGLVRCGWIREVPGDDVEGVCRIAGGGGGDVAGVTECPGEPCGYVLVGVVGHAAEFACVFACGRDGPGDGLGGSLPGDGAYAAGEEAGGEDCHVFCCVGF